LSDRATATVVGVLYIIGTVTGVLSAVITAPILSGTDVLTKIAASQPQMVIATLFLLTMGFALAMVPVVFYPVGRRYSEVLSMGYVVFRGTIETMAYVVGALGWLFLLALSRAPAAASATTAGGVQLGVGVLWDQVIPIPFALGGLMFYWLLFRYRLVPRWLSAWGLVGAVLYLAAPLTYMFGLPWGFLMGPLAIQEMVMAVWLIAKGFSLAEDRAPVAPQQVD
jgi:hypothetical protein